MGFSWGQSREAREAREARGANGTLAIYKVCFSPIEGVFRQGRHLVATTLKGCSGSPLGWGRSKIALLPPGYSYLSLT